MNARTTKRLLDWSPDDVLGRFAGATSRCVRHPRKLRRWLATAIVILGSPVAFGGTWLDSVFPGNPPTAQQPEIVWTEAHGPAALDAVPKNCANLRCFDFDDAAVARLAAWPDLERLDLSGMDVNAKGFSMAPQITDAAITTLGTLTNLRWLALGNCSKVTGSTLSTLDRLPLLESLDLRGTAVDSQALAALPRLPSLRELSLSWCMSFHGRALADVAKIPGLRRLDLRGCVTIGAADALHLANVPGLRHLDLRDCQGKFWGQTLSVDGDEPEDPPVQDGIGITDDVIAALAQRQLRTLLLGGCQSLTDRGVASACGISSLESLDLSNLRTTTGAHLETLPRGLTALDLGRNPQWPVAALDRVPELPELREFGLSGLPQLADATFAKLLAGKRLLVLRVGGPAGRSAMTGASGQAIAGQRQLVELDLRFGDWMDPTAMKAIASLTELRRLDLTGRRSNPRRPATHLLPNLASNRSIVDLNLRWRWVAPEQLAALADLPLQRLQVAGTNLTTNDVRKVAPNWPGCAITMLNGQRYFAPR